MKISLQKVCPDYIEQEKIDRSDLWNNELVFQQEEKVQIIAPSGSGKTSLIHFLYGLRNDYTGAVFYNTDNIKNFDAEKFSIWRQQHVSIIFQDLRLFPEHTVQQNLDIKRLLNPFHKESRIESMTQQLGIGNKLNKLCKTCSYGEQQRIAIIRALQQPFNFLLMDEPFSHLDENNRIKAMKLIEDECAERKATIILADLKKIDFFQADRIVYL